MTGLGAIAASGALTAGQAIGGGIGLYATFRFIRWLAEFVARRLDARSDRLERREKNIEERYDARLKHVEADLDRYRSATMMLLKAIAEIDPKNSALGDVARILRSTVPVVPPSDDLDGLIDKLRAVPGTREGRNGHAAD